MPWLETNPMDERVRFIVELEEGVYSVAELSARFPALPQFLQGQSRLPVPFCRLHSTAPAPS